MLGNGSCKPPCKKIPGEEQESDEGKGGSADLQAPLAQIGEGISVQVSIEHHHKKHEIDKHGAGSGKGNSPVLIDVYGERYNNDVDNDRQKTGNNRIFGFVEGIKSRYKHFVCRIGKEAYGVKAEGIRRSQSICSAEGTVLVNQADDRLG